MARGGNDVYNPVPEVSPSSAGGDFDGSRANANDFGAQVGGALQQFGDTVAKSDETAANLLVQRQGMINEAVQTNAETDYIKQASQIQAAYRSKEGLAAVAAYPDYEKAIAALRPALSKGMNPAQVKGFDMLARRHEANFITDGGLYQAAQVKAADTRSANDAMNLAIDRSGDFSVAANPDRWRDTVQDIDFNLNRTINNQGYGEGSNSGMKQNPDGTLIFDTKTPQGQQANAVYQNERNKALGTAWENRIQALANDPTGGNINIANKVYQENKDSIPPEAQAKLGAWLQPRVRGAQAHTVADNIVAGANGAYQSGLSGGNNTGASVEASIKGVIPGVTFTSGQRTPEQNAAVGGVTNSAHLQDRARDLVPPPGMTLDDAADKIRAANPGLKVVVEAAGAAHSTGPHIHVEWPASHQAQLSGTKTFQSQADFYEEHYDDLLQKSDAEAERLYPGDQVYADQQRARVQQRLDGAIHAQARAYKADADTVYGALNGSGHGSPPQSLEELRAIPGVGPALDRMWVNTPQAASHIENMVTANASGPAASYGADFYTTLRSVLAPTNDPAYVHDPKQFSGKVTRGNNGPLSNTGFNALSDIMGMRGNPQGEALAAQTRDFLSNVHGLISGADPRTGVVDHVGEQKFNQYLGTVVPAIIAGYKEGKTGAQLFDPKSPDYIGGSAMNFTRPVAERIKNMSDDMVVSSMYGPKPVPPEISSSIDAAVHSKQLTADQGALVKDIMQQYKSNRITAQQAKARIIAAIPSLAPPPPVPGAHE